MAVTQSCLTDQSWVTPRFEEVDNDKIETKEEGLKWVFSKPTYVIHCTPEISLNKTTLPDMFWEVCMHTQACRTLYNPVDCSLPRSSVHRIFQTRILEWVAISYSRGIFPTQGWNLCLLCLLPWQADFLTNSTIWEAPLGGYYNAVYMLCVYVYIYIYVDFLTTICFYLKEGHMFSKAFSSLYV